MHCVRPQIYRGGRVAIVNRSNGWNLENAGCDDRARMRTTTIIGSHDANDPEYLDRPSSTVLKGTFAKLAALLIDGPATFDLTQQIEAVGFALGLLPAEALIIARIEASNVSAARTRKHL